MKSNSSRSNSCSRSVNFKPMDTQFSNPLPKAYPERRLRGRSQSLQRQQKYPPPITPIKLKPTQQQHEWSLKKSDVIQQKSEIQEDENLQQMVEEIEILSDVNLRRSSFQISSDSPTPVHVHHHRMFQCSPLSLNQTREGDNYMHEESPHKQEMSELVHIIEVCLVFWKREQFNELDNKKFYQLIKAHILIHFRPAPLNEMGQMLLENGFFILAFIKYMTSRNVDKGIRSMMFDIFKNEFNIVSNREEFIQAYNANLKEGEIKSSQESNYDARTERKDSEEEKQEGDEPKVRKQFRLSNNLKRKQSDEISREYSYRSRERTSSKIYKNLEGMIVKKLVSTALGSLREFLLVETQNSKYEQFQFILIPKKKEQMINSSSLNQAYYQAEQITGSPLIFFFPSPGPKFDPIYESVNTPLKQ